MKRISDHIQLISVTAIIACLGAMLFLTPDSSFSEYENRTLATFPRLTFASLAKGEFTGDMAEYLADQFPFRHVFVAGKAYSALARGDTENNGVVHAGDTLIPRQELGGVRLERNLLAIGNFRDATGVPTVVAALPRTVDVYAERMPHTYPREYDSALWGEYRTLCEEYSLTAPDMYTELCEGEDYYLTDHHYTTHGAYTAYRLLADSLGYTPYPRDFFTEEQVSDGFLGTSARTSGFYLTDRDSIVLYRYEGDGDYTVTADGESISLYRLSALDTTDKYAVFLGGNHARVDITSSGDRRPLLLVVRDSFADSIAPFLALHYDLLMVDLRYYTGSVQQLAVDEGADAALILESMTELATSGNLSYLNIPFKEVSDERTAD